MCEAPNKISQGPQQITTGQWWASYFYKVATLLYFRYLLKKLATFDPLPIFNCNGSATVTSYRFLNVTKLLLVTTKSNELRNGTLTPLHIIIGGWSAIPLLW